MKFKVILKQNNSDMCVVCGTNNTLSLGTQYYGLEDGRVIGVLTGKDIHQSFPGRMHGGLIVSLIDETMGRAVQINEPDTWAVTADLQVKYLKPVPLDEEIYVVGMVTDNKRRLFLGEGYIFNKNKEILATATARFMKLTVEQISGAGALTDEEWFQYPIDNPPLEFDLPK